MFECYYVFGGWDLVWVDLVLVLVEYGCIEVFGGGEVLVEFGSGDYFVE